MRKIIVFALAAMLVASAGFAQQAAAPAVEEFSGKVNSINPIDPSRNVTEGSIYIRDDAGKTPMFIINPDTVILDEASKDMDSDDINDGDMVKVTYVATPNMGKIAKTISRTGKSEKKGIPLLNKIGL